jgi:hypothetical protein
MNSKERKKRANTIANVASSMGMLQNVRSKEFKAIYPSKAKDIALWENVALQTLLTPPNSSSDHPLGNVLCDITWRQIWKVHGYWTMLSGSVLGSILVA